MLDIRLIYFVHNNDCLTQCLSWNQHKLIELDEGYSLFSICIRREGDWNELFSMLYKEIMLQVWRLGCYEDLLIWIFIVDSSSYSTNQNRLSVPSRHLYKDTCIESLCKIQSALSYHCLPVPNTWNLDVQSILCEWSAIVFLHELIFCHIHPCLLR